MCLLRLVLAAPLLLPGCSHLGEDPLPPLHRAARAGDVEAIQSLIRSGADPNRLAGHHPWSPVFHAIYCGQRQAVLALLNSGADPNLPLRSGFTPLMLAAAYGDVEIVRALLEKGATPRDSRGNRSRALARAVGGSADLDHFTLGRCQTGVVRALLEADPGLQLPADWTAQFARTAAMLGGCSAVLKMVDSRRSTFSED